MKARVGSVFKGTISGVVRSGVFVQIDDLLAEGFMPYHTLDDDYYVYDEKKHQATGKRSNMRYRLGDRIEVIIARVDEESREIDLLSSKKIEKKKGKSKKR